GACALPIYGIAFPQHRDEEAAALADRAPQLSMLVLRIELNIGYVDNRALHDRPDGPMVPAGTRRVDPMRRLEGFGGVVVVGNHVEQLAVELKECAEESGAQSHGALDDRVEDRLHVGLRPADHPQNLARGRLLVEGFAHLRVARHTRTALHLHLLTL